MLIKRYLPNSLSLLRFLLGAAYGILLVLKFSRDSADLFRPLSACFALIVGTDLLDGRAARRFDAVTPFGAVLDVTADSFFIFSALAVHNIFGTLPVWFTAIVILKFADFLVTSRLARGHGKSTPFLFDLFGRVAAGCFFAAPYAAILPLPSRLLLTLLLFAAGMSLLSSARRWLSVLPGVRESLFSVRYFDFISLFRSILQVFSLDNTHQSKL